MRRTLISTLVFVMEAAKAGARNQPLTIPAGKHGGFSPEQRTLIFTTIREFLAKNGLGPR